MDSVVLPDVLQYRSPRALVLAGKLTIPEVFEWHAKENPKLPFFRFFDGRRLNTITSVQVIWAIRRAARYVRQRAGTISKVIAVIASADTITYSMTSMGILRAGHTMFLISPRNVPIAVVDMLRKTDCKDILVSQDAPVQELVKIAAQDIEGIAVHPMPSFGDLFLQNDVSLTAAEHSDDVSDLPTSWNLEDVAVILHSSGSTNHPKPIRWTYKRMTGWGSTPWYGSVDIKQATMSIHCTPMFHGIGMFTICSSVNNGVLLTTFPPSSPPIFPTPENVFEGVEKTSSEYVMTAPDFVEAWSHDPRKVRYIKQMKALIFGGAPLNKEVGDTLASQGISLWSLYGSTEIGGLARFYQDKPGMDWEYFELNPLHEMVTQDVGEGKYELIVLSDPNCPLAIVNTKVGDRDAYATNDLLEPHPTRPGMWKYHGRIDHQIILSNGEKTNPGPLEDIINEESHVQACIIFGQGKFQNGVLIEPKPECRFDPQDVSKLQAFRNDIWPTIERANAFAPTHSRIFKEMIMVTSPSKPFTYNIKNYPKRHVLLKQYHDEIEALYAEVEQSAQSDILGPLVWDLKGTRAFVRAVVQKVVQRSLSEDADFFRNGCDSLQATWIRNTILRVLREQSKAAAQRLAPGIVFQAPSVSALTEAVLQAVHDTPAAAVGTIAEDLVRIAERYSADLPARPPHLLPRESSRDTILITGTTGGFGCDVLEHLLRDEKVAKVYAFNRPGSQAMERQRARFRERGLQQNLLDSTKFVMVEAALDILDFGIAPDLLQEIRGSITHIMHNAWTVNFNLSLSTFEPDIKAVRNLVELALSSPFADSPCLQLVSSIGISEHCTISPPVPEIAMDPSSALGSGYRESKWVAERILHNATERCNLRSVSVRLGQVSGDKNGHWNTREWFPALVKSALHTRCLPDVEGAVSFIPAYPAARAFIEMRDSPTEILHLIHPKPVAWQTLMAPIANELDVPLVPYSTWLTELERVAPSDASEEEVSKVMRENPALHLLDFFRARARTAPGCEPLGMPILSTEKARGVSETLSHLLPLNEVNAKQWVASWRASGFLDMHMNRA